MNCNFIPRMNWAHPVWPPQLGVGDFQPPCSFGTSALARGLSTASALLPLLPFSFPRLSIAATIGEVVALNGSGHGRAALALRQRCGRLWGRQRLEPTAALFVQSRERSAWPSEGSGASTPVTPFRCRWVLPTRLQACRT